MITSNVPFAILALLLIIAPLSIEAKCNSCGLNNGIACVNETSFHVCYNSVPDTRTTLTCADNKICTRASIRCVDRNMGLDPDCNINKGCGICDDSKMFTCTSRTTFAQCHDGNVIGEHRKCPSGWFCNSSGKEVCVNECNLPAQLECERENPL